jgi:hypothetical protein
MLTERFVKLRHEQREISYLVLTVDWKGLRLRETNPNSRGQVTITFRTNLRTFTSMPIVDSTALAGSHDSQSALPGGGSKRD